MDKEDNETRPSEPTVKINKKPSQSSKRKRTTNNLLIYILDRQLGRMRNDVDLSKWVWMLS
ncbi:embryonic testis differentiation protein homolog B-like [Cynocephalus volans]|uniref:embryonic testis differentiation protein homolog B-like n=1 Tax=Cynocephalus volans TaxID=110931 RepID=UPI002FC71D72